MADAASLSGARSHARGAPTAIGCHGWRTLSWPGDDVGWRSVPHVLRLLDVDLVPRIVVGVVVLLVRWLGGSEYPLFRPSGQPSRTALDILKERLAKGEIDVAEFEERKRAL